MKKAITIIMAFVMLTAVLTGCGCDHEWQDADCQAPMTCKLCGKTEGELGEHTWVDADCDTPKTCSVCNTTEGEPLGHTWVDADCDTPKTCSVCNATEGEPLGHDMAEANYQSPATCKNCDYTEGEVLTPDFVTYGLPVIDAQMGVEYDYVTSCYDNSDKKTVGKLVLSDYEVFASAEGYEALDGYEWHRVTITIKFSDDNAWNYGFNIQPAWDDYYKLDVWDDESSEVFTVNYNGIDYDQCIDRVGDYSLSGWLNKTNTYTGEFAWRVPVGYDGHLQGYYDPSVDYEDGQYAYEFLNESNCIFFRFPNAK